MNVDVAIIGGGPAGVTAGVVLQERGYKTCIIDSQSFPREKLCGGVLSSRSLHLLQHVYGKELLKALDAHSIKTAALFFKNELIGYYQLHRRYDVIERKEFDAALIESYKRSEGCLIENENQYYIDYKKSAIQLENNQRICYKYLIGADGINSGVRAFVDKPWKAAALCFEGFVPNDRGENMIEIYLGNVFGGYNWRIPGKKRVAIGLGEIFFRGWRRTPQKYKSYFSQQGISDLREIKGAFLPIGYYVRKPVKGNVLLVGDAAGLINAVSGEGIFYAMESGRQAALAISDDCKGNRPLKDYINRISKIHKEIRIQRVYYKLLYFPGIQFICMKYAKKHYGFVQNVLDKGTSCIKPFRI